MQELVAVTPNSRDWPGILISILVILSIIGMVALVIRMHPPDSSQSLSRKKITVSDVVEGSLTPKSPLTWWVGKVYLSLAWLRVQIFRVTE